MHPDANTVPGRLVGVALESEGAALTRDAMAAHAAWLRADGTDRAAAAVLRARYGAALLRLARYQGDARKAAWARALLAASTPPPRARGSIGP